MATWAGPETFNNSYTTGTLKYDINEAIFRITPDDTPFYNMIGDTDATAVLHETMEEELTTRGYNAELEGAAWGTLQNPISQTRVQNRVQTLKKSVVVSRLMQRVRQWGVSDMFGSNMLKRMREWKTDAEHAAIRGSQATGTSNVASQMDGAMWCITTSGNLINQSGSSFIESTLNDLFQMVWTDGGFPEDLIVGPRGKRRITSFKGQADQAFFNVDNTKIRRTISVYEGDFTTVQIHLSRDIRDTTTANQSDVLLVTAPLFKKAWIDRPFAQRIPPTGDGMFGVILGDFTIECGARKAHGAILNTNMVYTV